MVESKYTATDLKIMQSWSLERKIQVSQTRILEAYKIYKNMCYVSFSGGKDSSVLADLTARVCEVLNCKLVLWFSDTGLEFPEIKKHVKEFPTYLKNRYGIEVELIVDYPRDKSGKRISFRDVVLTEGYPVISKTISRQVHDVKKLGKDCWAYGCFNGRETGVYNMQKWKYLIDAPFKISNKCCQIMKKNPAKRFNKGSRRIPIIGTMACESKQRKTEWLHNGCNAFDKGEPSSQPISFWTENDVLEYLYRFDVPYPSVYGEICIDEDSKYYCTGYSRTGCVFCAYGCNLEKGANRFQRLLKTHPKLWLYCMKPVRSGGLGMARVLRYIGVKYF